MRTETAYNMPNMAISISGLSFFDGKERLR